MSQYCIYIPLEDYLAQWFTHGQGGTLPVQLARGSVESKVLELYLARRPDGAVPVAAAEGLLPVAIPTFRHKPPCTYNHLPKHAMAALLSIIRSRFDVQLFSDLHTFGNIGKEQKELIYAWMEKHGIEITDTNWNAIAKRYQRLRNAYLARERAKSHYSHRKSG